MDRLKQIEELNQFLLEEMPRYREQAAQFPHTVSEQRRLLRSLMNLRPPMPLDPAFLRPQDKLLSTEREEKGVVDGDRLPGTPSDQRLALWQGDITRLRCGAIVNAANSGMTGCYVPCHACIDNCIHTYAGVQLRLDCARLMEAQGREEPTGRARLTRAYNLPCDYVLHTVGPIIQDRVRAEDRRLLAGCYRSCLELAAENGLESVAFCCISTGIFHFPNQPAAQIAVKTVRDFLAGNTSVKKVIFNVFKDQDNEIYHRLLSR